MRFFPLALFCVVGSPLLAAASGAASVGERVFRADGLVDGVGINTHFGYRGGPREVWAQQFEALAASVHELGIRTVRDSVRLGAELDRLNKLYDRYGIRTDVIVFQKGKPAEQVAQQSAEWIETFRKRVNPKAVIAFEGPNEYNDTREERPNWPAENVLMQAAIFRKVRSCPEYAHCEIIAPSVWFRIHDDFAALARTDIAQYCTRSCAHYYTGGNIPTLFLRHPKFDTGKWSQMAEVIADARLLVPGRPIWITETGYGYMADRRDDATTISEQSVGKYLPRLLTEWYRTGNVERMFIYLLIDDVKNFGLLRNDLSRRPAFHAVKHLLTMLADPGEAAGTAAFPCTMSGVDENVHSLVLRKRSGEIDILLWQEVPSWDIATTKELHPAVQHATLTFPKAVSGDVVLPGQRATPGEPFGAFAQQTTITVGVPDEVLVVRVKP